MSATVESGRSLDHHTGATMFAYRLRVGRRATGRRGFDMKYRAIPGAVAAIAAMAATPAAAVDLFGLNVPDGPIFSVAQFYANTPVAIGDTYSGYGEVDLINSIAVSSLCTNCELTYRFTDYVVTSISPTEIRFTGGEVNFYLGFGANNDFSTLNSGGSAGDLAEVTNGTLFLTLVGHEIDAAGNTLVGTGTVIGTSSASGFGGLLDVGSGGAANGYFNTNSLPALFGAGNADLGFSASFSALPPVYPAECPGGPACVRGSAAFSNVGLAMSVPEPATWGLMLLGFLGMGAVMRRRRRQAIRRESAPSRVF
jgi:hypothetical protein